MTNSPDLLHLADYAARQSDRWLFIAALFVLGFVVYLVSKYFVKQHEALLAENKQARDDSQKALTELVERGHSTAKDLAIVIDRNTRALEDVNSSVRWCRDNPQNQTKSLV